jgi:hypothetical protein
VPVRAVYSPSHPVAVDRQSNYQVNAGYEGHDLLPDTDFALYYSLGEEQAFHLVTYRDTNDPRIPTASSCFCWHRARMPSRKLFPRM